MVSALTSPVDHLACPPCLWLDPFKLRRVLSEYCVATTATHPPQGASGAGRVPVRSSPCEYVISRPEQQEQKLAAVEDADKAQQHSTAAKPERGRAQTLVVLHGKAKVVWAAGSATAGVVTFLSGAHSAGPACRLPIHVRLLAGSYGCLRTTADAGADASPPTSVLARGAGMAALSVAARLPPRRSLRCIRALSVGAGIGTGLPAASVLALAAEDEDEDDEEEKWGQVLAPAQRGRRRGPRPGRATTRRLRTRRELLLSRWSAWAGKKPCPGGG